MKLRHVAAMVILLIMNTGFNATAKENADNFMDLENYQRLTKELTEMISFPRFDLQPIEEEIIVSIRFSITEDDKIIVLEIDGAYDAVNNHVWSMLNGQVLKSHLVDSGKEFTTRVRFVN